MNHFQTYKLSTDLASGKDAVPASKPRGVVYEIPFGNCEHRYIGETKRSLSTRLKEHHRDTLPRNILKNPEKTALTNMQPNVAMLSVGITPMFYITVCGKKSFLSKESDTLKSYRVYISPTM